jgi:hypothetical protein
VSLAWGGQRPRASQLHRALPVTSQPQAPDRLPDNDSRNSSLLDRDDLRDSVAQIRRGEGRVLRPVRSDVPPDSR